MSSTYHFLPWTRKGLATAISQQDTLDSNTPASVSMAAHIEINEQVQTQQLNLRLHHPGDVSGINMLSIIRKEPAPWVRDFEPNFFPVIDFDLPDFPWLFTPASANAQERLRPWLVLVTVRQQDGVNIHPASGNSLPVLHIEAPAVPDVELPNLEDSWAWAHSQVVVGAETDAMGNLLGADSNKNLSRLISPRKLAPHETYYACLVPAFEAGRKTGLGMSLDPIDEQSLQPAWLSGAQAPSEIELPIYYHWEFSTGDAGDFESLVRKLQARPLPPEVGQREVDVVDQPFNLPNLGTMMLEGALRPATAPPNQPQIPQNFNDQLENVLNLSATEPGEDPIVTPPVYGSIHMSQTTVPDEMESPAWMRELNLNPIHRIAAGLGTLVVQDQQEDLMAAAWEWSGEKEVQQAVQQMQLAKEVSNRIFKKHLKTLVSTDSLFQLTSPVQSFVKVSDDLLNEIFANDESEDTGESTNKTFQHHLKTTVLPKAVFSQSFQRVARHSGQIAKHFLQQQRVQPQQLTLHFTQSPIYFKIPGPGSISVSVLQDQLSDIPQDNSSTTVLGRLNQALPDLQAYMGQVTTQAAQIEEQANAQKNFAPNGVELLQQNLLNQLDPEVNMKKLAQSKLVLPNVGPPDGNDFDPLDPQQSPLIIPEFSVPMYEPLQDIDQNLLLPGIEHIPDNTVTLLQTNPAFVAAYMLGLNHEMSREFLWREYPAVLNGTYFQQFWESLSENGEQVDCPPIQNWHSNLGLDEQCTTGSDEGQLVFLIRGELLRRFPGAILYAVQATPTGELEEGSERYPIFQGHVDPDISFFGFDMTVADAVGTPGWFFVIQQQPTEPRFGLDVDRIGGLSNWNNLTWADVTTDPQVSYLPLSSPLEGTVFQNTEWGYNGAHMAMISVKRPLRIAIPASSILPTQNQTS